MKYTRREILILITGGSAAAALGYVNGNERAKFYFDLLGIDPEATKRALPVCRQCQGQYTYTETIESRSFNGIVDELYGCRSPISDLIFRRRLTNSIRQLNNLDSVPQYLHKDQQLIFPCLP